MSIKIKKYTDSVAGKYFRKAGEYDPENGWQRKWTYKVGWTGCSTVISLVAMTDGMIMKGFTPESFVEWVNDNGMVMMTREEMMEFMFFTGRG